MILIIGVSLSIASLIFLIIGIEYIIPYIIKKIMIYRLKLKCKGKLVLTYDDGPGPVLEPKLLNILNKHNAKAAFFLHGMRAELFPAQCDLLLHSGYELGCHGYSHLNAYKNAPWIISEDIKKSYRVLEKWIKKDRIFRPPQGRLTLSMCLFLFRNKIKIIFWTVDSGDTYLTLPGPDSIIKKVIRDHGAVVLLHSYDRVLHDKDERCEYVLNLTQQLLITAEQYNLKVCTINELTDSSAR